jgi:hypothetical protein
MTRSELPTNKMRTHFAIYAINLSIVDPDWLVLEQSIVNNYMLRD